MDKDLELTGFYSFLLGREEYVTAMLWRWKRIHRRKPRSFLFLVLGSLLIAAGILSMMNLLLPPSCKWLAALGVICWFIELIYLPMLVRLHVLWNYLGREELYEINTYTFDGDKVHIENARLSGDVLLSSATEYFETPYVYCFLFDDEVCIMLPKRLWEDE